MKCSEYDIEDIGVWSMIKEYSDPEYDMRTTNLQMLIRQFAFNFVDILSNLNSFTASF